MRHKEISARQQTSTFLSNLVKPSGLPPEKWSYSLAEAKIIIESWRRHYNTKRPHSSLGYRTPAPEVVQWPASPPGPASPTTPAVAPETRHALRLEPDHPIGAGQL